MADATVAQRTEPTTRVRAVEPTAPTAKPVKYWAVVGAGFVLLQAYVYTRWITSDRFGRIAPGPDTQDGIIEVGTIALQILGPALILVFGYLFLVRPLVRERRLTLDGMLFLAALLTVWVDPLINYTQNFANYNSNYLNRGSWAEFVPGWMAPNGSNFPEPLLPIGMMYGVAMVGGLIIGDKVMTAVKNRRPQTGTLGLILTCYVFFVVADTLIEAVFMRFGLYVYPGSHEGASLFGGNYYQFPVYQALLWGAAWTALASMRHFRNDRGESLAERGIDGVKAPTKQRTFLRFLAVVGMFNAIVVIYLAAFNWVSLNQSDWPEDVTDRSYFVSEMCSPPDARACPGPDVPIARPDSGFLGSDGEYVPAP